MSADEHARLAPRQAVGADLVRDSRVALARIQTLVALRPRALGFAMALNPRAEAHGEAQPRSRRHCSAIAVAGDRVDGESPPVLVIDLQGDEQALARVLAPLFETRPSPYLVFADAQEALHGLRHLGFAPERFGCIKTAGTLLAEGSDGLRDFRPLDACVEDALGVPLSAPSWPPELALAAAADVLLALMRAYTQRLRSSRLDHLYTFECRLLPAVVAMEARGMAIDAGAFERIADGWVHERVALAPGGEISTDPTASERIRRLDKLISTYRWWGRDHVDSDGRIRCRLDPLATDSGRFACSAPNLQQVPSEHTAPGLRSCFRAPAGWRLIIADYAQIELRVAAHLAPCAALREVFLQGRDPHRATAATLTGHAEAQVTDLERQLAKAVNFGFLFGMGPRRFKSYAESSYGLSISDAEAADARDAFFSTFPGIAAWHRRVGALERGSDASPVTVTTVMGRRKRFPPGEFSFNAALNIPVQGSAAEGFKLAVTRLHPALAAIGGHGVMCVHDEYIAEVPEEQAEPARALVGETMRAAMHELIHSLPIVVEANVAESWGEK